MHREVGVFENMAALGIFIALLLTWIYWHEGVSLVCPLDNPDSKKVGMVY